MNPMFKTIAVCVLSSTLLTACSSSSNSTATTTDVSAKYQGTYLAVCELDGEGESYTDELVVSGLTATLTTTEYNDAECINPVATLIIGFSLEFPGGTQTTSLGDADFLNTSITDYSINGVTQDISGLSEEDKSDYTLVLLDGINLYTGNTDDDEIGNSPETRATTIGQDFLVRQ